MPIESMPQLTRGYMSSASRTIMEGQCKPHKNSKVCLATIQAPSRAECHLSHQIEHILKGMLGGFQVCIHGQAVWLQLRVLLELQVQLRSYLL